MSRVFVTSDLHFGHEKIIEFAGDYREGATPQENMDVICKKWNDRVHKKDKVFVLGDICMDVSLMPIFDELNGSKVLIRGNHDEFSTEEYLKYFKEVHGLYKYRSKGFSAWLSHCPMHPSELRNRLNIHGHVHQNCITLENGQKDYRYFNACLENSDGAPTPMEWIKAGNYSGRDQWRELRNDFKSMKGIRTGSASRISPHDPTKHPWFTKEGRDREILQLKARQGSMDRLQEIIEDVMVNTGTKKIISDTIEDFEKDKERFLRVLREQEILLGNKTDDDR